MIANEDFKFRDELYDPKKGETVPIELLVDPYKGVIFRFTVVNFKVGEDQIPKIQYDYEIINTGEHTEVSLRKDEHFNKSIGVLLNALLLEVNEKGEMGETGTDDNQESNSERELHEEGPTVS